MDCIDARCSTITVRSVDWGPRGRQEIGAPGATQGRKPPPRTPVLTAAPEATRRKQRGKAPLPLSRFLIGAAAVAAARGAEAAPVPRPGPSPSRRSPSSFPRSQRAPRDFHELADRFRGKGGRGAAIQGGGAGFSPAGLCLEGEAPGKHAPRAVGQVSRGCPGSSRARRRRRDAPRRVSRLEGAWRLTLPRQLPRAPSTRAHTRPRPGTLDAFGLPSGWWWKQKRASSAGMSHGLAAAAASTLQRSSSSEGAQQSHEEDERKVRRREKNRVAAQRSRKKQTQKADKLHEEYECLEQENISLKREIGKLTDELKHLSEALRNHEKVCPLLHCSLNFGLIPRPDILSSPLPR
uniref:Basic leucine zipper transcriptional factor ATF-like 3 n=1 Tax=Pogona vitticeps TaxID=103695 RepID=A0ABM5F9M7_9SAUR